MTTDQDAAIADMLAKYRSGELTAEKAEIVRAFIDKVAALAAGWDRVDEYRRMLQSAVCAGDAKATEVTG
jgi:hypothetical protein